MIRTVDGDEVGFGVGGFRSDGTRTPSGVGIGVLGIEGVKAGGVGGVGRFRAAGGPGGIRHEESAPELEFTSPVAFLIIDPFFAVIFTASRVRAEIGISGTPTILQLSVAPVAVRLLTVILL